MLRSQEGASVGEIVVVDSGSIDGTVEIARNQGAKVVQIEPAEFDYSKALNLGIGQVDAEVVVLLSAHAIPVDSTWLATMVARFGDPQVAGVSCRQVPWSDADWHEQIRLQLAYGTTPHIYTGSAESPNFSNAAACIRRRAWLAQPFLLPAVEDIDWARRVLAAGWTIVYEPGAEVYHSHNESANARAVRLIDISRVHRGRAGAASSQLLTLREAAALVRRELKAILRLDTTYAAKLRYLFGTLSTAALFVVRYREPGSTAERR